MALVAPSSKRQVAQSWLCQRSDWGFFEVDPYFSKVQCIVVGQGGASDPRGDGGRRPQPLRRRDLIVALVDFRQRLW